MGYLRDELGIVGYLRDELGIVGYLRDGGTMGEMTGCCLMHLVFAVYELISGDHHNSIVLSHLVSFSTCLYRTTWPCGIPPRRRTEGGGTMVIV